MAPQGRHGEQIELNGRLGGCLLHRMSLLLAQSGHSREHGQTIPTTAAGRHGNQSFGLSLPLCLSADRGRTFDGSDVSLKTFPQLICTGLIGDKGGEIVGELIVGEGFQPWGR